MAGDWIKMRGNLWDDPRIGRLVDMTDTSEAAVIGGLYWLWATADQHTEDGLLPGLSLRRIDSKTGIKGFGQALADIGWIVDHTDAISIVKFEEHNGTSAKKRCQTAKRVSSYRSNNADVTQSELQESNDSVSDALAREEKRREEEITHTSPAKLPTCQASAVIDLYHEILPEMPSVKLETADRKRAIRKLWQWVLTSKKTDGERRAENAEEALQWVRGYFARARENDFLMGRIARGGEHANWRCDLDFLLTDKGMKHVIERTGVTG